MIRHSYEYKLLFAAKLRDEYWNAAGAKIRLFRFNVDFSGDLNTGMFSEANFSGYTEQDFNNFGDPEMVAGNKSEMIAERHEWIQESTDTTCDVYGYYVVDAANHLVYADKRSGGPITMDAAGKPYYVDPVMQGDDIQP